jgi:putative lipoic acid-binding regulatory protein|tara:strand:- start:305 stop:574 length:270 start_codon:yes stop_codon:yes gene_type:complete
MTEKNQPKIVFPCDYPIKVLGEAHTSFNEHVLAVMDKHAPGFDRQKISVRDSSKGSWQAMTVVIEATGKSQLESIFAALKTSPRVKMVL